MEIWLLIKCIMYFKVLPISWFLGFLVVPFEIPYAVIVDRSMYKLVKKICFAMEATSTSDL